MNSKQIHVVPRVCRALRTALLAELVLARRMLELLQAQTRSLLEYDPTGFARLQDQVSDVVSQQIPASLVRDIAIKELATALGQFDLESGRLPGLADIALHLPLPEARSVVSVRMQILDTHSAIREVMQRNAPMIGNALDFVQFTIHSVADAASQPKQYGRRSGPTVAPTLYVDSAA